MAYHMALNELEDDNDILHDEFIRACRAFARDPNRSTMLAQMEAFVDFHTATNGDCLELSDELSKMEIQCRAHLGGRP